MPDDIRTTKWLAEKSGLPESRFRFYAEADEAALATISRGILFLFAYWSGPAHMAFERLSRIVGDVDPGARLEFVVVDIDGARRICELPEFREIVHGNGEAAWVRGGRIEAVAAAHLRTDSSQNYEHFTRQLLDDHAA